MRAENRFVWIAAATAAEAQAVHTRRTNRRTSARATGQSPREDYNNNNIMRDTREKRWRRKEKKRSTERVRERERERTTTVTGETG